MRTIMKKFCQTVLLGALALIVAENVQASILIVNGSSGTSEPGTTAAITSNLNTLLQAVGNTTVISDLVPADLSPYSQVWDIRFSNNLAITAGQQAQYLSFLQGGGGMFVMGENSSFPTRNNSVLALISAAGGGNLGFVTPNSTQTVLAPFTGPNAVSQVTYAAPGGVGTNGPGTGQFITWDGTNGTGLAFGIGTLANAPLGALTTIFDVNFMQNSFNLPNSQNLLKNLIQFVDDEVSPPGVVPEPATLLVWGLLVGLGGTLSYRKLIKSVDQA